MRSSHMSSGSLVFEVKLVTASGFNDPLEIDYADYNMLPACVEQADEVAFTLDKLVKHWRMPKKWDFL